MQSSPAHLAPGAPAGKMPLARGVGKWKGEWEGRREVAKGVAVENFNLFNYTCYDLHAIIIYYVYYIY